MCRNKLLAIIPTTMILLTANQVRAERFEFRGRVIVLEAPQGYCALDSHRANELKMIQQRKMMLDLYGEVAMVYADCKELEQFRKGDPVPLDDIGLLSIGKEIGKIVPVYGISRRKFVDDTLKSMEEADLSHFQEIVDIGAKKARSAQSVNVSPIHVLDHDEAAVYVGGTLPVIRMDGSTIFRDSVNAATLINGLKIGVEVSRPSIEGGLKLLLAMQHGNISALIRANASIDSTSANFRMDWTAIWVIAVLTAPMGLVVFLASRRPR
jgi:hypothetical protein